MYESYVTPEVFRKRYSRIKKLSTGARKGSGGFWTADKVRGRNYIFIVCEGCFQLLTERFSFFTLDFDNELTPRDCLHCLCEAEEHDHFLQMVDVPAELRELLEEKCR